MILYIFLGITICFTSIAAIISIYNLLTRPVLEYVPHTNNLGKPILSVLIPARNEQNSIGRTLQTITQQTYRNIEIIVLDDHSDDRTGQIVNSIANTEPRLRLIQGKPLPSGWIGKNWACHQLAKEANGEILLFIDADVQLAPEAIASALRHLENNNADALSVFPTQILQSLGERLIVPLMNWLLLSFLPLHLVFRSSNPKFIAANGQFMLIRENLYSGIGGHAAVKDKIVEDMEIARLIKNSGKKIITLLGGELISCHMYTGLNDSMNGFTKNFYAGFNIHRYSFIALVSILFIVFLGPLILVLEELLYIYPILIIFINRLSVSLISRQSPTYNILLHPIQMLLMMIIGIRSVEAYTTNKIQWKGRQV